MSDFSWSSTRMCDCIINIDLTHWCLHLASNILGKKQIEIAVGTVWWTFKLVVCVWHVFQVTHEGVFFFPPPAVYWKCERFLKLTWQFARHALHDEIKLQPEARYVYSVTCWCDAFPGALSSEVIAGYSQSRTNDEEQKNLHASEIRKNLLRGSQVSIEQWYRRNRGTRATFLWDTRIFSLFLCAHMARQLCTHGWLSLWSADMPQILSYLVSNHPAGTRLGCKLNGDDGVLVVSCFFLLLLLYKRETLCWGHMFEHGISVLAHWRAHK